MTVQSGGTRCASGSIGHRQIDNDANKPTNIYLSTCANRKYADDDRCESRLTKILSSTFLLVTVLDLHKPVVVVTVNNNMYIYTLSCARNVITSIQLAGPCQLFRGHFLND
ncbi:hypothetical protein Tsp_07870 [Trichinella spiralis]|uniref:hypothetical protein n=1 Tax=Trichinella spiralis TaxID=6334 RepID=UPI0001EFB271|nr:hypothetical protein Tsp_07870 [Trichinella spiralis]